MNRLDDDEREEEGKRQCLRCNLEEPEKLRL